MIVVAAFRSRLSVRLVSTMSDGEFQGLVEQRGGHLRITDTLGHSPRRDWWLLTTMEVRWTSAVNAGAKMHRFAGAKMHQMMLAKGPRTGGLFIWHQAWVGCPPACPSWRGVIGACSD